MSEQMRTFLKTKYLEMKHANPHYSVRTFALKAGVSSGAMSEILNGKRSISKDLAEKICRNLKLNPTERSRFFGSTVDLTKSEKKIGYLTSKQFASIHDQYYFSLLALIETSNFKSDDNWIAQRLGILPEQAQYVVYRLKQMGLIAEKEGHLVKTKAVFSTTDDVKDDFIQRAHHETLKSALNSLRHDPVNLRDFTSFTFPTDPQLMGLVKERIRLFQDEIAELMTQNQTTEVYKLAIQFFPITKKERVS
jgi:uncharacterized protein (TIGR02147 family)